MSYNKNSKEIYAGQKVILKTKRQLLATGYKEAHGVLHLISSPAIVSEMMNYLGKAVTIRAAEDTMFTIEEDFRNYRWGYNTISEICDDNPNKCHISINEILDNTFKLEE